MTFIIKEIVKNTEEYINSLPKEEKKALKVNLLLQNSLQHDWLEIENHINYLKSTELIHFNALKGVFVLLNSSLYNSYFKILNGTTQINASDLNSLPCPAYEDIQCIGDSITDLNSNDLAECDRLIYEYYIKKDNKVAHLINKVIGANANLE